ncbi:MAG: tRNA preQ1(34) S-adenosylmethionine ribosyltransferase-isomerase QueA [Desulfobulbaceae bacterium]|jgi:S-adenosylmethionine:tRNA ribosyltransferase-isomerase|nr:tRNA preQ1(34) S-adenosylmethionine ribosyltransferase-isomerase QueA [Desulfobulbaceae bacterium]
MPQLSTQPADFLLSSYRYTVPSGQIAQYPAEKRDEARLLMLDAESGRIDHGRFADIQTLLKANDVLIINDTRVFPARLLGHKASGGKAEIFLLALPRLVAPGQATAMALVKSSKRPKPGGEIFIGDALRALVEEDVGDGKLRLRLFFPPHERLDELLARCGRIPLPPYISRDQERTEDRGRYQTVYAAKPGAVAAPTAGLHFTPELLAALVEKGVSIGRLTLHVGYGTFAPVRAEHILEHTIHSEYIEVPEECVAAIGESRRRGGKVWAVGTTTTRALEYAAALGGGELKATRAWCDLYIYPGFQFRVVDNLITNFHLPETSLMFLVAAFCGRERLLACYETAIQRGYRFYSYGDAMAVYR